MGLGSKLDPLGCELGSELDPFGMRTNVKRLSHVHILREFDLGCLTLIKNLREIRLRFNLLILSYNLIDQFFFFFFFETETRISLTLKLKYNRTQPQGEKKQT